MLEVQETPLPGVLLLRPKAFGDARGSFVESWNRREFEAAVGQAADFVQDNHSRSARGVLRGLHYQQPHPQGKLVRVLRGEVYDVVVDLRRGSPTFGRWLGEVLAEADGRQLWIPPGLAHGFLALTDGAELLYKATGYYHPEAERCIRWDDPALAIAWPLGGAAPLLSPKDGRGVAFADAPTF